MRLEPLHRIRFTHPEAGTSSSRAAGMLHLSDDDRYRRLKDVVELVWEPIAP